jgi:hypothetical protein
MSAGSAPTGEPEPGCEPPQDAAEGDSWLCVVVGTPDAQALQADRERLAALARETESGSDEEAQRAGDERLRQIAEEYEAAHPELAAEKDALVASGVLPADRGALLIRTDFAHQEQWETLQRTLSTPSPEGFMPTLSTIEHQRWNGTSAADLAAAAAPSVLLVLADTVTFSSPEMPLLVLQSGVEGLREMRVVPGALASVENNLSIANMDWVDFAGAADPDGVFRGFD